VQPYPPQFRFPVKIHMMLEDAAKEGNEHIVSWLPCGEAFRIQHRSEFTARMLPRYFGTIKIKSFLRQLNIYSFQRIPDMFWGGGCGAFAYKHASFLRGNPMLCFRMVRTKVKRTGSKIPWQNETPLPKATKITACGGEEMGQQEEIVATKKREQYRQQWKDQQQAEGSGKTPWKNLSPLKKTAARIVSCDEEMFGAKMHQQLPTTASRNPSRRTVLALASDTLKKEQLPTTASRNPSRRRVLALVSDTLKKEQNTTSSDLLVSRSTINQSEENDENKHPSGLPLLSVARLLQPKGIHPELAAEIISIFSVRDEVPLQIKPAPCS
jgi:hypothetical protein